MITSIHKTSPLIKCLDRYEGIDECIFLHTEIIPGCIVCNKSILSKRVEASRTNVIFDGEFICYDDTYYILGPIKKHPNCRELFNLCPLNYINGQHDYLDPDNLS